MQLRPRFFTARIKSLLVSQPSASATAWAALLSKPVLLCRFCFISQFFGLADGGTRNSVHPGLIIRCSLAFASVPVRSRSFFSFKKVNRPPPFQSFLQF